MGYNVGKWLEDGVLMESIESFLKVLSLMQSGERQHELAKPLLECAVAMVGADRGYIVMREDKSYDMKHQINLDSKRDEARHTFSRSLVREAIRSGKVTFSPNLSEDQRFQNAQSINAWDHQSVIAVPMTVREAVFAVLYLERDPGDGPFSEADLKRLQDFLEVTGLSIKRALRLEELERFRQSFADTLGEQGRFAGIISVSPLMAQLLQTVSQVGPTNATVLIRGETGSGKELIARAIFENSERADKPFETLHCGALPETLFEAELFGHKRGSFTGADRDRPGRIAQAKGGTLFIDEVAEIPLASQAKLLRFFQFGEFQRVGSDSVEKVDVRVIAATHRDLKEMVQAGQFREDLYYRLNVIELRIPPLRERRMDVMPLFQHFLKKFWSRDEPLQLSPALANVLETYDYPGNVRELEHAVQRLCVMAMDSRPELHCLPPAFQDHEARNHPKSNHSQASWHFPNYDSETLKQVRKLATQDVVDRVEQSFLEGLMEEANHNVSEAARLSGMNRTYLYQLLGRHKEAIRFREKS